MNYSDKEIKFFKKYSIPVNLSDIKSATCSTSAQCHTTIVETFAGATGNGQWAQVDNT